MKKAIIAKVEIIKMMCGTIICTHCGNRQSAEAWHHDRKVIPVKDCAYRCNACGNPFPEPDVADH